MKKSISIIFLGIFNLLHFSSHLIQLIQSLLLIKTNNNDTKDYYHSNHSEDSIIDSMLHNPYFNIVWIIVAFYTIYAGIVDFKYHKNHLEKNN